MAYGSSAVRTVQNFLSLGLPRTKKTILIGGLIAVAGVLVIYALLCATGSPTGMTGSVFGIPFEISILAFIMCIVFWVDGNYYIRQYQLGMSHYSYAVSSAFVMVAVVL